MSNTINRLSLKEGVDSEIHMLTKAFEGHISMLESRIAELKTLGRSRDHALHNMHSSIHELTMIAGKLEALNLIKGSIKGE